MKQMNLSTTAETDVQTWRTDLWVPGGKRVDWEVGISRCKLLYVEWVSNRSYHIAQGTIFNILR